LGNTPLSVGKGGWGSMNTKNEDRKKKKQRQERLTGAGSLWVQPGLSFRSVQRRCSEGKSGSGPITAPQPQLRHLAAWTALGGPAWG
jgi:hypothetical protein